MMNGLRKTFWSSIHHKKKHVDDDSHELHQPKPSSRFGFFSNPSTPRSETRPDSKSTVRCHTWSAISVANATPSPSSSLPASPKLHCRTSGDVTPVTTPTTPTTPRRNRSPLSLMSVSSSCSTPSSPKSPASFSLFKSKLCFTKSGGGSRCGICLQSVKAGRGTAIFTAECSHTFHFPCVASSRSGDRNLLAECPVCGVSWRETSLLPSPPPLSLHELKSPKSGSESDYRIRESSKGGNKSLRVYNDDEALITSPMSPGGFNTIPESDENDEDEEEEDNGEFKGFFVNTPSPLTLKKHFTEYSVSGHVDVQLSTDAAIVAVGKGNETYSVVMKIKSPSLPTVARRSPVDLVTVLDVSGGKIETVKKAMRLVISSLRETDRLSMVSFSSSSKRLTPLRRMTANGRRIARRIVDEISGDGDGMSVHDAVKKAAKVIEDRRQKNLYATIFVLTDRKAHQAQLVKSDFVSSTRFSHLEIPTHTIWLGACNHTLPEDALPKRVKSLLSLSVQDLSLNLGLVSGSGQGEITAVYSLSGRPVWLGSGSIRLGDMYGDEVREVLVELKSPTSGKSHRIMTVRSRHVDPTTQEIRNSEDRALLIPRPITVRSSSTTNIARLRNLHVSTRAVAESRRLIEANDYSGAERMLTSARALLVHYGLTSNDACLRGLDAELTDLNRMRGRQVAVKSPEPVAQKAEPLTPTSAWRAAERLAKVAIMRKHMNRVSDLHGFENARF